MRFTTQLVTFALFLGEGAIAQRLGATASKQKEGLSDGSKNDVGATHHVTFNEDAVIHLDEDAHEKLHLAAISMEENKDTLRRRRLSKKDRVRQINNDCFFLHLIISKEKTNLSYSFLTILSTKNKFQNVEKSSHQGNGLCWMSRGED